MSAITLFLIAITFLGAAITIAITFNEEISILKPKIIKYDDKFTKRLQIRKDSELYSCQS